MQPRRGEVWWVAFDAAVGGEIHKTRPAIILSNNAANTALNRVVVVPVTSSTEKLYPSETLVAIGGDKKKAMADQLTTASKRRLQNRLAVLSAADVRAVENAVLLHLGIRRPGLARQ
jgi:mRNA interferase MazF